MKKSARKIISMFLAMLMILSVVPAVNVFAVDIVDSGTCGENLTWTLDSEGTLTVSGEGEMSDLYWEEEYDIPWYRDRDSIKTVVISDGVTSIGAAAFNHYNNLTKAVISSSVTNIGDFVFGRCRSLKNIIVNEKNPNYSSVDGILFNIDKTKLIAYPAGKTDNSFTIPNSVTKIGELAFGACTNLTSITIPNSVTIIGSWAFEDCTNLTNITIPTSVTSTGYWSFSGCTSLTNIIIPENVTSIDDGAFYECRGLTSITIPDSVTSIGEYAFEICDNLTNITIPKSVTEIGKYAVGYGEGESKVDNFIIDGYIGTAAEKYAIENGFEFRIICNHQTSSHIEYTEVPATCTENGYTAGIYCNECERWLSGHKVIEAHHTDNNNDEICDVCGEETVLSIRAGETKSIEIIANEITYIKFVPEVSGDYTFESNSSDDTYGYLFNKDKIELLSNDDGDEDNNFSITEHLVAGNTYYWGARYYNSEKAGSFDVSLTNSELEIKSGICGDNLTWSIDEDGILTISGTGDMYACEETYYAPWYNVSESINSIVIENGVKTISDYAFFNIESVADITISESVESIGENAFTGCTSLELITIPKNVKSIGASAFKFCEGLKDIAVDTNNTNYSSLDGVLFNKEKTMLHSYPEGKKDNSYTIPSGVKRVNDYAFMFCRNLINVVIPNGITYIGEFAFSACENLKKVVIPSSATTIGNDAFTSCNNLISVTIFDGTESIGDYAFYGCNNLKSIAIPKSVKNIGSTALGYTVAHEYIHAKVDGFTINGYKATAAEKYAKDNGFTFVDLSHTHSYKATVTKKATCTANGVMKYTCSYGDSYTKAIKALGHKYTTTTTKSTLTKDGSTVTKCKVCGAIKSKTTIASVKTISLSKTSFTYNSKAQKPSVVIKDRTGKTLKNGTDYTVKYSSGCKNVGQYSVTITLKGKYAGTKTLTYRILPKGTSISKLTAGKKQFTAKWSAQTAQTTGYELQYSTSSSMSGTKTVTVGKNKATSSTVKKLKGKKKYYVRIRTYKTVKIGGKSVKLYSAWSKVKSVKTK